MSGGLADEYLGYLKSFGPLLFAELMIRADGYCWIMLTSGWSPYLVLAVVALNQLCGGFELWWH